MNPKELERRLGEMSEVQFVEFVREFGGGFTDRQAVVRALVDKPSLERRLCQLLSMPTEDEKRTLAATDAARSSKRSAIAAIISAAIAVLSLLATIILQLCHR